MSAPRVDVTVVTWNSAAEISACLEGLARSTRWPERLVVTVVDNASADDTVAATRRALDGLGLVGDVVEAGSNLGFASAANVGLERADGAWWFVLNPDARPTSGSLDLLMATAEAGADIGIASALLTDDDGAPVPMVEHDLSAARIVLGALRPGDRRRARPARSGVDVEEVDWVHGAAWLLPTDLARRLGGYDTDFFLYGEDMDLCRRARATGRRVVVVAAARVTHVGGASTGRVDDAVTAARRAAAVLTHVHKHEGPTTARLLARWMVIQRSVRAAVSPDMAEHRAVAAVARSATDDGRPAWPDAAGSVAGGGRDGETR